jgi:hypothetical protein
MITILPFSIFEVHTGHGSVYLGVFVLGVFLLLDPRKGRERVIPAELLWRDEWLLYRTALRSTIRFQSRRCCCAMPIR